MSLGTKRLTSVVLILCGTLIVPLLAPGDVARAQTGPRVALQVGHWRAAEAPEPLRVSTGGSVAGVDEWALNLIIAEHLADDLRAAGIAVELLPSWFPTNYRADAFVALHINGSPHPDQRGFFADRAEDSVIPEVEDRLVGRINESIAAATPLPYVYRPTRASRRYYGYYRVTGETPAVLVEMGFLTNADDRAFLTSSPQTVARTLARAIREFLADGRPDQPPPGRSGRVQAAWGGGAVLRERPTRRSAALALIPDRSGIAIHETRPGEQLDHGDGTWHAVAWQGSRGYVYADLVADGE